MSFKIDVVNPLENAAEIALAKLELSSLILTSILPFSPKELTTYKTELFRF